MSGHRQVNVKGVDVDEGLADLLGMLWDAGIRTEYSCQSRWNAAYIIFASVEDAVRFMEETLAVVGFYGVFCDQLTLKMACRAPWGVVDYSGVPDYPRAVVEWPHEFTQTWTRAWNGESRDWQTELDLARAT